MRGEARGRKGNEEKEKVAGPGAGTRPGDFPGLQITCLMLCPISIPLSRKSFQKSPNSLTELILVVRGWRVGEIKKGLVFTLGLMIKSHACVFASRLAPGEQTF